MNAEIARLAKYLRGVAAQWRESAKACDEVGHAALSGRAAGAEWAADELERQAEGIAESIALAAKGEALAVMMRALRKRDAA